MRLCAVGAFSGGKGERRERKETRHVVTYPDEGEKQVNAKERQEPGKCRDGLCLCCPDLAAMMGFCDHCYRDNVQILWPYLTCYCQCNGVGVFAPLTVNRDNGKGEIRIGAWKMKMEKSRAEFEGKLPGLSREKDLEIKIRFL